MRASRLLPWLLSLAVAALPPAAAAQTLDAAVAPAGRSGLAGVVTDVDDKPLLGALVTVDGHELQDLTAGKGEFRLSGLPAGTQRFLVRRVGYRPIVFELELPDRATVTVHVRMQENVVSLGTMLIEGQRHSLPLWRNGFYDRAARQALGYFYPPDEILRRRITTMAAILGEVPGIHLERQGYAVVPFGRWSGTDQCRLNVWIDGALASAGPADLDALAPGPIVRAIEIYPSPTSLPARFVRSNNKCGAIVIWTKGVVRELF